MQLKLLITSRINLTEYNYRLYIYILFYDLI